MRLSFLSASSSSAFAVLALAGCLEPEEPIEPNDPAATVFADATPEERGLLFAAARGDSAQLAMTALTAAVTDAAMGDCLRAEQSDAHTITYVAENCTGASTGNVYDGAFVLEEEVILDPTEVGDVEQADDRSGAVVRSTTLRWQTFSVSGGGGVVVFDGRMTVRSKGEADVVVYDLDTWIGGGRPVTIDAVSRSSDEAEIFVALGGVEFEPGEDDGRATLHSAHESIVMDLQSVDEETGCGEAYLADGASVAVCLPSSTLIVAPF